MNAEHAASDSLRPSGETDRRSIAQFPGRLAALRFVAGSGHAPRRALPDSTRTALSGASS